VSKVLILTASFGDGHNQVAYAVQEALDKRGATTKVVDYLEWINPILRKFTKVGLVQSVKKLPALYGAFYRYMASPRSSPLNRQLNHLGQAKMRICLEEFAPDIIACTFPTPLGVISELRAEGFTSIPVAAILTDYAAHRQWAHENTDMYFTATEEVKIELTSFGVARDKIVVTGIPVRSIFSLPMHRNMLRQKHKLNINQPLALIMGGGDGLFTSDCETIVTHENAQFVIVCGRNQRLYKRMQRLESERIKVLGYVKNIHEWMAMSDVTITKAGGITVTEAMSMGLPMLLLNSIPGQEEKNAEYAVKSGAAILVHDVYSVLDFLDVIERTPSRLHVMSEAARSTVHQESAQLVATRLLNLARSRQQLTVGTI
jgi:processive 1,2-diacylglycerol beta-glucosyltransferase